MKMKPGWGFIVMTPDGQKVKATSEVREGRRAIFVAEFSEGFDVDPFKGNPPEGPVNRPHRWVRGREGG